MTGVTRFFDAEVAVKKSTMWNVPADANVAGAGIPVRSLAASATPNIYQDRSARGSSAVHDKISEGRLVTLDLETDLSYENLVELLLACGLGAVNNAGQVVAGKSSTYEYSYHIVDDPASFFTLLANLQVTDNYNETGLVEYPGCIPTSITISGVAGAEPIRMRTSLLAWDELFRVATTLASDIAADATTIVGAGKGAYFNERGYIILDDGTNTEIVYYAAIDRANHTFLSCLRGQLGSTANAFASVTPTNVYSLSAATGVGSITYPSTPLVEWDDFQLRINANSGAALGTGDSKSIAGFTLTMNFAHRHRLGAFGLAEQPHKIDFNEVTLAIDRHQIDEMAPRFDLRNDTAYKAALLFTNPNLVDATDGLPYQIEIRLPNLKFTDAPRSIGGGGEIAPTDTYVALEGNQPTGMDKLIDGTTTFTRELEMRLQNGRSASVLA